MKKRRAFWKESLFNFGGLGQPVSPLPRAISLPTLVSSLSLSLSLSSLSLLGVCGIYIYIYIYIIHIDTQRLTKTVKKRREEKRRDKYGSERKKWQWEWVQWWWPTSHLTTSLLNPTISDLLPDPSWLPLFTLFLSEYQSFSSSFNDDKIMALF